VISSVALFLGGGLGPDAAAALPTDRYRLEEIERVVHLAGLLEILEEVCLKQLETLRDVVVESAERVALDIEVAMMWWWCGVVMW